MQKKVLVIDCGSPRVPEIISHVQKEGLTVHCKHYSSHKEELPHASAVIISGSPLEWSKINVQEMLGYFSWLKNSSVPVFGICFGHQIISQTFGGTFHRHATIERMETIKIVPETNDDILLKGLCAYDFLQSHSYTVSVPDEFIKLAYSDSCPNEAMRHIKKPIMSVQFHPEISGEQGVIVLKNFLQTIQHT